jgi:hypothetical protein
LIARDEAVDVDGMFRARSCVHETRRRAVPSTIASKEMVAECVRRLSLPGASGGNGREIGERDHRLDDSLPVKRGVGDGRSAFQ